MHADREPGPAGLICWYLERADWTGRAPPFNRHDGHARIALLARARRPATAWAGCPHARGLYIVRVINL